MKNIFKILILLFISLFISGCMLEYDGIGPNPYYRDIYPRYFIYPYHGYPYYYRYYTPKPYYYVPKSTPKPHYGPRR